MNRSRESLKLVHGAVERREMGEDAISIEDPGRVTCPKAVNRSRNRLTAQTIFEIPQRSAIEDHMGQAGPSHFVKHAVRVFEIREYAGKQDDIGGFGGEAGLQVAKKPQLIALKMSGAAVGERGLLDNVPAQRGNAFERTAALVKGAAQGSADIDDSERASLVHGRPQ